MHLAKVSELRKEYKEWEKEFRQWVRVQRIEQSAALRARIRDAVQGAYAEGESIAAIMRAYGTSDRTTIRKMLDEVAPQDLAVTYRFDGYTVSDGREKIAFEVEDTQLGKVAFVEGEDALTDLGKMLNDPRSELQRKAIAHVATLD